MEDQKPVNPLAASLIRTAVPVVAGVLLAWLTKAGFKIDSDLVTAAITGAFTMAYYTAVRVFEHLSSSKWGWLLGKPVKPVYPTPIRPAP